MRSAAARVLKSPREIKLMRAAGRLVNEVLCELERQVRPGRTTAELNETATRMITEAGATALFLGYPNPAARFPFPASICASVNEVVVHGIPDERPLQEGDIVSIDCGVRLKGYCGDAARTYEVGRVSPVARDLLEATRGALELAVAEIRPNVRWSRVARKMQRFIESRKFGVVRDFVGHGIGQQMHEQPGVPNYWDPGQGGADFELVPGMTLAIEPMVTAGRPEVDFGDASRWTVVTRDGSLAAHFENTVAVTDSGAEVLSNGS